MSARGCAAIPLAFALCRHHTAAPDGAGKPAAHETDPHRGDNQIFRLHKRCPDFAALVAR